MDFIYSKNPDENLRQRVKLLLAAKDNIELQQIIKRKCSEDPIFFFNMFLFTFKPKAVGDEWEPENPNIPFITFPFQDEYIRDIIWCIENSQDNSTEKSREMWFSWMILGAAGVWGWIFRWWSWLIGSYKEDYVDTKGDMDSSFERLRYMLERLPEWMKQAISLVSICLYPPRNYERKYQEMRERHSVQDDDVSGYFSMSSLYGNLTRLHSERQRTLRTVVSSVELQKGNLMYTERSWLGIRTTFICVYESFDYTGNNIRLRPKHGMRNKRLSEQSLIWRPSLI